MLNKELIIVGYVDLRQLHAETKRVFDIKRKKI